MTEAECRNLHLYQQFTTPDGNSHNIHLEEETVLKGFDLGKIEGISGRVSCQGQQLWVRIYIVPDMVVVSQYKVLISQVTLKQFGSQLVLDQNILPPECDIENCQCLIGNQQVMWVSLRKNCPL